MAHATAIVSLLFFGGIIISFRCSCIPSRIPEIEIFPQIMQPIHFGRRPQPPPTMFGGKTWPCKHWFEMLKHRASYQVVSSYYIRLNYGNRIEYTEYTSKAEGTSGQLAYCWYSDRKCRSAQLGTLYNETSRLMHLPESVRLVYETGGCVI